MLRLVPLAALAACSLTPARPDAPASAWSAGPAMPRRALDAGVTALGQQLIVAGGFDAGASGGLDITARVDALDPLAGAWSALPDAPVHWTHINLAAVGPTLYLLGGLEGPRVIARGDAFALDPLDHAWRPIAAIDAADARGAAGVIAAPGRVYLLGGASSTGPVASCLEYDVALDRWTHLPDLPAPRAHPAAMRTLDGTLIVAGGFASFDASMPRSEVWALAPPGSAERTWQPRAPMVDGETGGGCAYGVVLGELVCAGGASGRGALGTVASYAPYTDMWTVREPMPIDRAGAQAAAIGGRLFVPGGSETLTGEPTATLYIYAPLDTQPR